METQAKGIIVIFGVTFATALIMKMACIPFWARLPLNMVIGGCIGHHYDKLIAKEQQELAEQALRNIRFGELVFKTNKDPKVQVQA